MNDAAFEGLSTLLTTHAKIVRAFDAKIGGHHGLSLSELTLLRAIALKPDGKGRPTELARELHLSASGVTRALLPSRSAASSAANPTRPTGGPVLLP